LNTVGRQHLLDLDPAEQVLPSNGFQQGGVIGAHVLADCRNCLVIGIAAGDEPAFAADDSGQRFLLVQLYAPGVDTMLA
jgi:hypothetical protein